MLLFAVEQPIAQNTTSVTLNLSSSTLELALVLIVCLSSLVVLLLINYRIEFN